MAGGWVKWDDPPSPNTLLVAMVHRGILAKTPGDLKEKGRFKG